MITKHNLLKILANPIVQILGLSTLFLPLFVFKYSLDIQEYQESTLRNLSHIAKTSTIGFPIDELDSLLTQTPLSLDAITQSDQSVHYEVIHKYLHQVQSQNDMYTPVYILQRDKDSKTLAHFLVTSAQNPYFYHSYEIPPEIDLHSNVHGANGPYEDDNGIWLSAYASIPQHPEILLQVDMDIKVFREQLANKLIFQAIILIAIFFLIIFLTLWLNQYIKNQNMKRDQLETIHQDTGLYNDQGFQKYYRTWLAKLRNPSIILLSVHHADEIRDKLGKSNFIQLQKELIKRVESSFPGKVNIIYFEMGEYGVLLDHCPEDVELNNFAKTMKTTFTLQFHSKTIVQKVHSSIGYTKIQGSEKSNEVVRKCQVAIRKNRQKNNDLYTEYSDKLSQDNEFLLELEADIPAAISQNQFEVYYQAKVDHKGKIGGAEALLRWNHPEKGLISPGLFIPLLEESSQIHEVGIWVLREVARDIARWRSKFEFQHPVSANVSLTQFDHPDFYPSMEKFALEQFNHEFDIIQQLELEITESTLSQDRVSTITILEHLQELGIHISIDDFGTGYSNLHQLIDFPFNTLKLDRSFVMGLPNDSLSQSSSRLVIGLAKSLNKTIVAEGVENIDQHHWLIEEGVDLIQGFYWSKPIPREQFEQQFFCNFQN